MLREKKAAAEILNVNECLIIGRLLWLPWWVQCPN